MTSFNPPKPDGALRGTLEKSDPGMLALMYDELRRLAASFLRSERPDHTLQPTALVHEAYIKLLNQTGTRWRDPKQFKALASIAMRQILVDYARSHKAIKRQGRWGGQQVDLDEAVAITKNPNLPGIEILALNDALERLFTLDERQARVVELRFFGGLTNEEVADVLEISRATVVNDWTVARAWLSREINQKST
jgi:RNA polymerase sigma-70 factor, ECF subfamily